MPYALPLEVIELVIDQLDSNQPADTAALSSCTLACKALLPHSSRQLFKRRVSLDTVRLRQFTTALSTSYRLKAYVASLKVDVRRTDGMSSSLSALRLLREIVGTLTAVTALLVIGDRAVDKAVLRWIDEAPIATYPLEHLSVVGAQVPLTDAILGFFPEVRTLTVSEWPNDRYPGANVSAHAVRNLVFEDPLYRANVASVLDIVRVLSPPSLSSLALQFHDIHKEQMTFAAVNGLLRTLGRHISNFEIVRYSENWGAGADPGEHPPETVRLAVSRAYPTTPQPCPRFPNARPCAPPCCTPRSRCSVAPRPTPAGRTPSTCSAASRRTSRTSRSSRRSGRSSTLRASCMRWTGRGSSARCSTVPRSRAWMRCCASMRRRRSGWRI